MLVSFEVVGFVCAVICFLLFYCAVFWYRLEYGLVACSGVVLLGRFFTNFNNFYTRIILYI
jgi:hypothetical protein